MIALEYQHLQAERTELHRILAELPESSVIDRLSYQARLESVSERLNAAPVQLAIPDYTAPAPEPTNFDRFMAFHSANPHVLAAIISLALDMIDCRGMTRGSVKRIVEDLRWDPDFRINRSTGEPFRINNTFAAFYARLAMDTEPRLCGFFETRERAGE